MTSRADARCTNSRVIRPSSALLAAPIRFSSAVACLSLDASTGVLKTFLNTEASPSKPGHAKSMTAKNSPRSF